ncbi:hypothetical protein GJ496_001774 [Pomphorhynchus laevis]|nr:hypothetical protein GJ496_001774 [Pomphorhynchus laevis]
MEFDIDTSVSVIFDTLWKKIGCPKLITIQLDNQQQHAITTVMESVKSPLFGYPRTKAFNLILLECVDGQGIIFELCRKYPQLFNNRLECVKNLKLASAVEAQLEKLVTDAFLKKLYTASEENDWAAPIVVRNSPQATTEKALAKLMYGMKLDTIWNRLRPTMKNTENVIQHRDSRTAEHDVDTNNTSRNFDRPDNLDNQPEAFTERRLSTVYEEYLYATINF